MICCAQIINRPEPGQPGDGKPIFPAINGFDRNRIPVSVGIRRRD